MPNTNGHDSKKAILYAHVSSDDQVKGYSLDQQIGALRGWTAREDYEVLEEVRDEGCRRKVSVRDQEGFRA